MIKKEKINNEITAKTVRVILEDGTTEIMDLSKALKTAFDKSLDLIEVAPKANPVVCKIMEYSKYVYENTKKQKQQKAPKMKEVKFTSTIDTGDILYRLKNIKEFLSEGHKVKITLVYKGRTITHPEIGKEKLVKVIDEIKEFGLPQSEPKLEGKNLFVIVNPIKK